MFMIRNVSKYLFGDASKENLIEIPQGQLYLVRPHSVKGYSELIFKDAVASIRRTGQEYQHQLVIQRAYEEGEEELLAEEEGDDAVDALNPDKDEKAFLLDETLQFRTEIRDTDEKVFAWRDLSGDYSDLWEFVCDASVQPATVASFERIALQCQYERKYRRAHTAATEDDLHEFAFAEEPIPNASPLASPVSKPPLRTPSPEFARLSLDTLEAAEDIMVTRSAAKGKAAQRESASGLPRSPEAAGGRIMASENAELHLFDFESGVFVLQDGVVSASVSEIGKWRYWLQVNGNTNRRQWVARPVEDDLNPVFNFEYLSFIFNEYPRDGSACSWLLRFKNQDDLENFQQGVMQALWEHLNEMPWLKAKKDDQDFIMEAFEDLNMDDPMTEAPPDEEEEEEEDEDEDEEDHDQGSEHYDSDESADEEVARDEDGNVNSQLAVGYKHDRSFVVRGSKIGVFKHTPDNHLQFTTSISKVETPKGKLFSPKKVMLHMGDEKMILQNEENPHSLYQMDLEYGKVVDEWKVDDNIPVISFGPESKFAQRTDEQTFLGLANNAFFRVDPRVAGNKLVESEKQQYATKTDFSSLATTRLGRIAVASNKGDIRLFDRLGIRAKTSLPALGDPIISLDVSADGRWVLATTRTYLLLVDAQLKDKDGHIVKDKSGNATTGFEKSFARDRKPQPRRLALSPAHVAQFHHETKAALSFTAAHFNTGEDSAETTIITSTGPFVIVWSLSKILNDHKNTYRINRYTEEVKADNFKYGSDKNLIVALPNEVNMVAKKALQRPTRESIATPLRIGGGAGRRSSARRGYLSRDDIVNSPY